LSAANRLIIARRAALSSIRLAVIMSPERKVASETDGGQEYTVKVDVLGAFAGVLWPYVDGVIATGTYSLLVGLRADGTWNAWRLDVWCEPTDVRSGFWDTLASGIGPLPELPGAAAA
jgi:hypothetical protein